MKYLKRKILLFLSLLLLSSNLSFGEEQYPDFVLVKVEGETLTVSRELVTSEHENSILKLNVDALREKGFFSVHQPGKWCRDILVPPLGYVRVMIEVSNPVLNKKVGEVHFQIALLVAINRRPMVNRTLNIDLHHNKPLNKVVVRGSKNFAELHKGDEQPEIKYFLASKQYPHPGPSTNSEDLFLRFNEPPKPKSCFKEFWGVIYSNSNKYFD